MTDDDRRLSQRLGAYESRVPDPPGPTVTYGGRPPWAVFAAVGAAAVLAGVVIVNSVLSNNVGQADSTPTPSPTASAHPDPSRGASATETPNLEPESVEPTPSGPPAIPETWTEASTFSEPGRRFVVGDLVAWSDGLVAVGTRYDDENRGVFGPPPPHTGQVWRSTDGTDWTDATPAGIFADVELQHLFETADGALIAVGDIWTDLERTSAAWESDDGVTWTPVQLDGMPADAWVDQIASGARGHVASTYLDADARPLYSADGRTWEPTLENVAVYMVGAGDEGFVANVTGDGTEATTEVVASADGLEWFDAAEPARGAFLAAPRAGDWLAMTSNPGERSDVAAAWGSGNGLDWSPLGQMPLQSIERFETTCEEVPGILHGLPTMTVAGTVLGAGMCGEGAVVAAGGSYASVDGADWVRLPFGDYAYAAGAVLIGDRVVIATDTRTSRAPVIGVIFWVSEP